MSNVIASNKIYEVIGHVAKWKDTYMYESLLVLGKVIKISELESFFQCHQSQKSQCHCKEYQNFL